MRYYTPRKWERTRINQELLIPGFICNSWGWKIYIPYCREEKRVHKLPWKYRRSKDDIELCILKKLREVRGKNKYAYFKWEFIFLIKHHWESSWSKQNPAVITQMANNENIARQRGPSFLDIMPISLYKFSHIYSYIDQHFQVL